MTKKQETQKRFEGKNKGITVIALVITIIVLLILAGVVLATITGEDGVLNKAIESKEKTLNAEIKEKLDLTLQELYIEDYNNIDRTEYLKNELVNQGMELVWEFESYGTLYFKYNSYIIEVKTDTEQVEYTISDIIPNAIVNNFTGRTDSGFLIDVSQGGLSKEEISSFQVSSQVPNDYSISYDVSQTKDRTVMLYAVEDDEKKYSVTLVPKTGEKVVFPLNSNKLFQGCNNIKTIDLNNVSTYYVTNMQHMFYGCISLVDLNLSTINTSNVIKMDTMFYNCRSLQTLDLSSFDTKKVKKMNSMFRNCSNLKTIFIGNEWSEEYADTSDMFLNCGTNELTLK